MTQRLPITIQLDSFEGPLDLLLHLIQAHELDISKVSIGQITDQYLAYIRLMEELNFDLASEFLVMAATLLHWKSKAILPVEGVAAGAQAEADDDFSPEELVRQLLELRRFQEAGRRLALLPRLSEDVFVRGNGRPPVEKVWPELDVTRLALTYQDQLARARKRTTVLKKETVSLSDKIQQFADRLAPGRLTDFRELLSALADRSEVVVTFLASLELSRLRRLRLHQEEPFQAIFLELLQSLKDFNVDLAVGFDYGNALRGVQASVVGQGADAFTSDDFRAVSPPPAPVPSLSAESSAP